MSKVQMTSGNKEHSGGDNYDNRNYYDGFQNDDGDHHHYDGDEPEQMLKLLCGRDEK